MGLTQDAQISASQMPRSADDTPWPWFSCTTLGSMSNFFSFFFLYVTLAKKYRKALIP